MIFIIELNSIMMDFQKKNATLKFRGSLRNLSQHYPNFVNMKLKIVIVEHTKIVQTYTKLIKECKIGHQAWEFQIKVNFRFSFAQQLKLEIQEDGTKIRGSTYLSKVFRGKPKSVSFYDQSQIKRGEIYISAKQYIQWYQNILGVVWKGFDIKKPQFSFLQKNNLFLKFFRINDDLTYSEVNRTETIPDSQFPVWKRIDIPLKNLFDHHIKLSSFAVQCCHQSIKKKKEQILIGEIRVQVQKLKIYNVFGDIFALQNPNCARHQKIGRLVMQKCFLKPHTFISLLQSKIKFVFTIGVNLRKKEHLQSKILQTCQIIQKSWNIFRPFAHKKHQSLNIFNIAGMDSNLRQSQSFSIPHSQNNPEIESPPSLEKDLEVNLEKTPSPKKKSFGTSEELQKNFEMHYKNAQEFENSELTSIIPFLGIIDKIFKGDNLYYQIVLIITDSTFSEIEASKFQMAINQSPTSYFFVHVGQNGDELGDLMKFNEKRLQIKLEENYEAERVLSGFKKFGGDLESVGEFVGELFFPVEEHVLEYMEHVLEKIQNSQLNEEISRNTILAKSRRSSMSTEVTRSPAPTRL